MSNYWGYNTLGFFCPDPRLAQAKDPAEVAAEFRSMVDTFHRHDLEVVLDVVYNHTPEGNEHGPTLSFRGLDNASWYRLDASFRAENFTGCGNTVNIAHPQVTRFVLDSLRYWVQEMGVDGFRFDLAPVLGRTDHGFDAQAAFFIALRQDPLLAQVRLIAEPWDGGPDGYQVGRFPGRFQDWNDRFRDAMRGYWLGRAVDRGEFARRFTASNDLFHHHQRRPTASVNFIVAHDGFTLSDVVSYSRKRNLANGENNRDGRDDELSDNFGAEGATGDPTINLQRMRVRRAMMASLLLAQGTPMLCSGDEIGNSQHGNNNAYCQDNPTGWLDWGNADRGFCAFVAELIALRRGEPLLRHGSWFNEAGEHATGALLVWRLADGRLPAIADWHDPHFRALACVIGLADGSAASLLLVFNPGPAAMHFVLPTGNWSLLLDSGGELAGGPLEFSSSLDAPARCVVVLKQQPFPLDDP